MDVKYLIQGKYLRRKMICEHCRIPLSVRDREKEIETGDEQMNRTRGGGGLVEVI